MVRTEDCGVNMPIIFEGNIGVQMTAAGWGYEEESIDI
jgi:hypothetical protein